jgi:hypothetical protein
MHQEKSAVSMFRGYVTLHKFLCAAKPRGGGMQVLCGTCHACITLCYSPLDKHCPGPTPGGGWEP